MYKLLLTVLVCLSWFTGKSQSLPLDNTLLWKIEGKGITRPSYLYGTIHLMCPADLQVSEGLKEKFNSTEELFLEIKTDDPAMMAEMMKSMAMKNNTTIKSLMPKPDFDSINSIFKKSTGLPLEMLNTAKPILVTAMIYPSLLGCTPDSWEKVFENLAKKRNMPLKGLEKLSDQMDALEKIPYQQQADMMVKLMYNLDSARLVFNNMVDVYKRKDLNALYKLTTSDEDFGAFESALLITRNKNWIPVIEQQALQKPTFFACGAAHLAGENGVIRLLQKAGYTVSPVLY